MSYGRLLNNYDKKCGKYFASDNLMLDLTNFWRDADADGAETVTKRNSFFHNRPKYLEKLDEIFHLYALVEHFNGFDLVENNVEKNWFRIAFNFQMFRKSNESINIHELRCFYAKVILPVVRLAEGTALSAKLHSPWKSSSADASTAELLDLDFSSDSWKTKRFSSPDFVSTPRKVSSSKLEEDKPSKSRRQLKFVETDRTKQRCRKSAVRTKKPTAICRKKEDDRENEPIVINIDSDSTPPGTKRKIIARKSPDQMKVLSESQTHDVYYVPMIVDFQLASTSNTAKLLYFPVSCDGRAHQIRFPETIAEPEYHRCRKQNLIEENVLKPKM